MRHFIYPENQYRHDDITGPFTVDYDHEREEFDLAIVIGSGRVMAHLPAQGAAKLAGFILSKHPAIVKGDAMAFSSATRACDAIPEPDFTVIPPGHERLATAKGQDTKDDGQDVKVTVTTPDPESAKRATDALAATLRAAHDGPQPLLTEAQHEELRRLRAAAPADLGDLHPDQERRLTALREASKLPTGRLNHERLTEWAGWILNGDTPTN